MLDVGCARLTLSSLSRYDAALDAVGGFIKNSRERPPRKSGRGARASDAFSGAPRGQPQSQALACLVQRSDGREGGRPWPSRSNRILLFFFGTIFFCRNDSDASLSLSA